MTVTRREAFSVSALAGVGIAAARALPATAATGKTTAAGGLTSPHASTLSTNERRPQEDLPVSVRPASTPFSVTNESLPFDFSGEMQVKEGVFPADMTGHLFLVGAAPRGRKNASIFTGDARITRIDFSPTRASLTTRRLRTPCSFVDDILSERGRNGFLAFQNYGFARMSFAFGTRYFGNTAPVPLPGGGLLLGYDGCTPMVIDPLTLDVDTYMGRLGTDWKTGWPRVDALAMLFPELPEFFRGLNIDAGQLLKFAPFPLITTTAHPAVDMQSGEVFVPNFNADDTRIVRWSRSGLKSVRLIDQETRMPALIKFSCHQVCLSRNHVVLADCAFVTEQRQMMIDSSYIENQPDYVDLHIVRRDAVESASDGGDVPSIRVRITAAEAVHFLMDYEEKDGLLSFTIPHTAGSDASERILPSDRIAKETSRVASAYPFPQGRIGDGPLSYMQGYFTSSVCGGFVGRYVVDPHAGKIVEERRSSPEDAKLLWTLPFVTFAHSEKTTGPSVRHLFFNQTGFAREALPQRVYDAYEKRARLPDAEIPASLVRFDTHLMRVTDAYLFAPGEQAGSPTFVPRAGHGDNSGDLDGYIVALVFTDGGTSGKANDSFWIFDAADLKKGPICKLVHAAFNTVYTMHSAWAPDLKPLPADAPRVSAEEHFGLDNQRYDWIPPIILPVREILEEAYARFNEFRSRSV